MCKKLCYISGKITGLDIKRARLNFNMASVHIERTREFEAVNPMELVRYNPTWRWEDYMSADLTILLSCQAIALMDNWKDSRGARVEHAVAKELELEIIYLPF